MMKFVATTIQGIGDVTIKEVKEILGVEARKLFPGKVVFEAEDAGKLVKEGRSIAKACQLLAHFKFKDEREIYGGVKKISFKIKEPFVVRCGREGSHKFSSKEIERNVGEAIFKKGFKVNLENPSTKVVVDILDDNCLVGIEVADGLDKREYRVRPHNQSINACLAYALLRLAGYKPGEVLADPFCKDGVIPIEAAFYAKKPDGIHGLDDSANNIRNARANAGFAGLDLNLSKRNVDWLDTLFKKEEVDRIVTNPPFVSRALDVKDASRLYKEFFKQADYVLKKEGKVAIISIKPEPIKKEAEKFEIVEERESGIGEMNYKMVIFKKK